MKQDDLATQTPVASPESNAIGGRYSAETQYARAKIALSGAGLPHETQLPEVAG